MTAHRHCDWCNKEMQAWPPVQARQNIERPAAFGGLERDWFDFCDWSCAHQFALGRAVANANNPS